MCVQLQYSTQGVSGTQGVTGVQGVCGKWMHVCWACTGQYWYCTVRDGKRPQQSVPSHTVVPHTIRTTVAYRMYVVL